MTTGVLRRTYGELEMRGIRHMEVDRTDPTTRNGSRFEIRQQRHAATITLHVVGTVDTITTPRLATQLEVALTSGAALVILDLTDVDFLSAGAIGLLVDVQNLAHALPAELRVVASGRITLRPLIILGAEVFLEVHPSVAAASREPPSAR